MRAADSRQAQHAAELEVIRMLGYTGKIVAAVSWPVGMARWNPDPPFCRGDQKLNEVVGRNERQFGRSNASHCVESKAMQTTKRGQ